MVPCIHLAQVIAIVIFARDLMKSIIMSVIARFWKMLLESEYPKSVD